MKQALVVGGSNGIGLSLVNRLLDLSYDEVVILDKADPCVAHARVRYENVDLSAGDLSVFDRYPTPDLLLITAGWGRLAPFETTHPVEIERAFAVNTVAPIAILQKYYPRLAGKEPFACAVMSSIAAWVSSPLFALYGATKAALSRFVESVNIELEQAGAANRILDVSPGALPGTRFYGGENRVQELTAVTDAIFEALSEHRTRLIPGYEETYARVLREYQEDPHQFGLGSYAYKAKSGRIDNRPRVKIGYLSGTFDLFHVGHLNLLRRAKAYCDYLVVGVHPDARHKGKEAYIPYEERVRILQSVRYVDKVIPSKSEDMDVYADIPYDYLFVGSDYQGSERFARYEAFFADKPVQIIYLPYTQDTSSTKIREKLS